MKKIFVVISLFCYQMILSQVHSDFRPQIKSPEVNKFEQYTNLPVNMVSGTPLVNIPLYTLEYAGMQLPISLSYDASGVKVEDIASAVGLKWSLNVGGTVSRIIKGAPDEGNPHAAGFTRSFIDIDGYYQDYGLSKLESELNAYTAGDPNIGGNEQHPRYEQFIMWMQDATYGLKDSQPDLFYFSTPEGGSKFVFNQNREVVYLENTDFIVKENYTTNSFNSWNITSPNGILYKLGLQDAKESSYTSGVGQITNKFKTNAWFLSEIFNHKNAKKIEIKYVDNYYQNIFNNKPMKTTLPCLTNTGDFSQGTNCDETGALGYQSFANNPYAGGGNSQYLENHIQSKLISEIIAGETKITFSYSNREDLLPELNITPKRLDKISISYQGACIKEFDFTYSYSVAADFSTGIGQARKEAVRKRLMLDGVTEKSCDGTIEKPHSFEYNTTPLPNRLSYAQDKWGYYNGKTENKSLFPKYRVTQFANIADRSVNFNMGQAGALQKIIYPTGGSVNFGFEPHQSQQAVDYVYSDTPTSHLIRDINPNDNISGNSHTESFTMPTGDIAIRLRAYLAYPNPQYPNGYTSCGPGSQTAVKITDQQTGEIMLAIKYEELNNTPPTSITVDKFISSSLLVAGRNYDVTVNGVGYQSECLFVNANVTTHQGTPIYDVGGLRVNEVTHKDVNGTIAKNVTYTYAQPNLVSNPITVHRYEYDYNTIFNSLLNVLNYSNVDYLRRVAQTNQGAGLNYLEGYFFNYSPGFDPFEIQFMGPHISYNKVVESAGSGSTTYEYNAYKSYLELNSFQVSNTAPPIPITQSILAGDILTKADMKEGNTVGKESTEYTYNRNNTFVHGIISSGDIRSQSILTFKGYALQGQVKRTSKQISTIQDVTTERNYYYEGNGHNFPTRIVTTNSDGKQTTIKNYYPSDMDAEPFMGGLVNQNRINAPVVSETYISENTALGNLISKQSIVYDNTTSPSGLILPKIMKTQKNNGDLEPRMTYTSYDNFGNPTEVAKSDGTPMAYIWGYDHQYPVAKIENMTYSGVAAYVGEIQNKSNSDTDHKIGGQGTEGALRTELNKLRVELPADAMITTYTYDPMVGVTSMTDPRGYTVYYEYDDFNRLQYVRDADGNLISENKYHYKN